MVCLKRVLDSDINQKIIFKVTMLNISLLFYLSLLKIWQCDSPSRLHHVRFGMASLNPTSPGTRTVCHSCPPQDVSTNSTWFKSRPQHCRWYNSRESKNPKGYLETLARNGPVLRKLNNFLSHLFTLVSLNVYFVTATVVSDDLIQFKF